MKRSIALTCAAVIVAVGVFTSVRWRPLEKAQPVTAARPATPAAPAPGTPVPQATPMPVAGPGSAAAPGAPPAVVSSPPAPQTLPTAARIAARSQVHEDSPARQEAEAIALNLRHYGQRFGGNPEGTNAEIVKALNGGNAKGARYLPQENLRLNDQGELLDSFGTPYFFHQISSTEMEIRSAGPDKTLWTPDDIAVK